ncbi:MAG: DNA polymerase sliding clamp [Methermicoccaceae archaeon]
MFKAAIKVEPFRDAIDVMSTLVDESVFSVDTSGMISKAVEPANAAMVILEMETEAFEEFDGDSGELGIDLKKLSNVLDMTQKEELVELEVEEDGRLKFTIGGIRYRISMLDPGSVRRVPKIPQLQLPGKVVLDGGAFQRAIKAASSVGSYAALGIMDGTFYVDTEGDTDQLKIKLEQPDVSEVQGDDVKSLFSLDYLRAVSKTRACASSLVTIELGNDYPVRISFSLGEGMKTTYIIAPRVENV